jgi:biopolymer transport protein ExbD
MAELSTSESHKKGPKKVRGKKMSTRIDMTPMVDLAFLLVTFFIFTSTFSKPKVMEVVVPEKNKDTTNLPKVAAKEALTIMLGDNGKVFYYFGLAKPDSMPTIENTNFSPTGIRKVLNDFNDKTIANQKAAHPDKPAKGPVVLIKPLSTSKYSSLVAILDEMKITNIQIYALVDIQPYEADAIKGIQ